MKTKHFLILVAAMAHLLLTTGANARPVGSPIVVPGFTVVVAVSPAAQAKRKATQENVILTIAFTADFHNGTDPQTIVDRIDIDVPSDSPVVKMKALNLRPKIKALGTFNGVEVGGFSSRHQSEYNILDCSGNYLIPKDLATLQRLSLGMYCKLIGE